MHDYEMIQYIKRRVMRSRPRSIAKVWLKDIAAELGVSSSRVWALICKSDLDVVEIHKHPSAPVPYLLMMATEPGARLLMNGKRFESTPTTHLIYPDV